MLFRYLISADYTLAALELFAELAEDGIECPQLKEYSPISASMPVSTALACHSIDFFLQFCRARFRYVTR